MAAEARLEARCCRYAARHGAIAIKQRGGPAGTPDRLFVLPSGVVWWVEFKAPKGSVSLRQGLMIEALEVNKQHVDVVRDFDFFTRRFDLLASSKASGYTTPST